MSRYYDGGWSKRNYEAARASGGEGCLTTLFVLASTSLALYVLYQFVAPYLQSFEQLYRALGGG